MATRIAIHPDRMIHKNGEVQSYSDRWIEVARGMGVEVTSRRRFRRQTSSTS